MASNEHRKRYEKRKEELFNMPDKIIVLNETLQPKPFLVKHLLSDYSWEKTKRPAILICPGGAYEALAFDREGEDIAIQYNAVGFHAFVLHYSVAPKRYPEALKEASKAIEIIRENAEEWNIDAEKIAVIGFSAGGHLAGSLAMFWNREPIKKANQANKPNAAILCYPVISSGEFKHAGSFNNLCGDDAEIREKMSLENQVSEDTPPIFMWHTLQDEGVPPENSLLLASALRKKNKPFELHIFPQGLHGLGTCRDDVLYPYMRECTISRNIPQWLPLSIEWLKEVFEK